MFRFEQKAGRMLFDNGSTIELITIGYSGAGEGKNNPAMQEIIDVGPIPVGHYLIGEAFEHPQKGPVCMRLIPLPSTNTFGRSGFMIHGDSIEHPGRASEGCIILSRSARLQIAASPHYGLEVVSGEEKWQLA